MMVEFPYMRLPGGILRPTIPVVIHGPTGKRLLDGLLDTGSDRTISPQREATAIGIQLPLSPDGHIRTAGGLAIAYRLADTVLELRVSGASVRWTASVAFAEDPLNIIHLGNRGFLEFFHCTFQGPEKKVVLDARPSMPPA